MSNVKTMVTGRAWVLKCMLTIILNDKIRKSIHRRSYKYGNKLYIPKRNKLYLLRVLAIKNTNMLKNSYGMIT